MKPSTLRDQGQTRLFSHYQLFGGSNACDVAIAARISHSADQLIQATGRTSGFVRCAHFRRSRWCKQLTDADASSLVA
jgi:hypothetical protein